MSRRPGLRAQREALGASFALAWAMKLIQRLFAPKKPAPKAPRPLSEAELSAVQGGSKDSLIAVVIIIAVA